MTPATHTPSGAPPDPRPAQRTRGVALLGNVCVGKTSLFDRLCAGGANGANIPGSTLAVTTGVLAVGSAGAPRSVRRACAACLGAGPRRRPRCGAGTGCAIGTSRPDLVQLQPHRPAPDATAEVTHVYDTPGSNSMAATSEDEMVARDLLLSGWVDSVVMVADAKNLRRSLAIAFEVAELGMPMVLALNMVDEAEDKGLDIDADELSRELGVPVVETVAVEPRGIRRLAAALAAPAVPTAAVSFPPAVEAGLDRLTELLANPVVAPRALAILMMRGDRGATTWIAQQLDPSTVGRAAELIAEVQAELRTPIEQLIADAYYRQAERIADRVVTRRKRGPSPLVRIGHLAQQPLPGIALALVVLAVAYLWVGKFGAVFLVDTIQHRFFDGFLTPLFRDLLAPIPSPLVRDLFLDPDFGLLPTAVFLVFGLVLPVLFCFYFLLAVLEDSGYLPRLALLSDRVFRWFGLNGLGLIPLVLGFSCVTMAIISTRMVPSRRDRIILTLLVVGVPCAPLLAVMVVILGKLAITAGILVFGVIALRVLVVGHLAARVLPGTRSDLILEIPQMRVPRPRVLMAKTLRRSGEFIREALPIFVLASLLVFGFDRAGGLAALERLAHPITHGLLGLPDEAVQVFIRTTIRRESGAAELNQIGAAFTPLQLVVTLLVMTFVFPCVNALFVMIKERGVRVSGAILGTVIVIALVTGATINAVCQALGVTFT